MTALDTPWWENKRDELLTLGLSHSPCYVYDLQTLTDRANHLLALQSIDQLFYAIKANSHPAILQTLFSKNTNFECVSINELNHVLTLFPNIDKQRLLFTPNFAPRAEYEYALSLGCYVTIDSLYPLEHWPELFQGKSILIRIDPGKGVGHHKHVCTAGDESKFGIPKVDLPKVLKLTKQHNVRVIGLHAHSGSGILTPELWQETALMLATEASRFSDVSIINLGGGLGVIEQSGQKPLDTTALDESLLTIKSLYPQLSFWLEPGRYFVAECGVILAKVTQTKEKGTIRFVGIETGMNSLIRPALYGAYHEIVNVSRFMDEKSILVNIVGPICESGDTLGYERWLPNTHENDLILIANTGAYGFCMSSSYNLRTPAQEIILVQDM